MRICSTRAHAKLERDLLIRQSAGKQHHHLGFALGQGSRLIQPQLGFCRCRGMQRDTRVDQGICTAGRSMTLAARGRHRLKRQGRQTQLLLAVEE
jgi:hypothetical protein